MRFRVTKGSTFAFECCSSDVAKHKELQGLATRIEDLEALNIRDVNIVKRLDLADVDRMIEFAQQHPPQCVMRPASAEDAQAFEEFTAYLRQRQRAGVATLPSGFLLLLTPIHGWDSYLRCLVVKASNDTDVDVASIASYSSVRSEEERNDEAAEAPERLLSPRSRDARFAQLRHEYRAFNSHHYQVLQTWIAR